MLKKLIQIFICLGYWLCLTPWLIVLLINYEILNPRGLKEYFIQYTTLLFVLILCYWLIHRIFDHCYMKHEVRKRVRKLTIKRQLERLERGEIDIHEAQHLSTFTRASAPKSPKTRKSSRIKARLADNSSDVESIHSAKIPRSPRVSRSPKTQSRKNFKPAPPKPPTTTAETSEPPPYSDELVLLDEKN